MQLCYFYLFISKYIVIVRHIRYIYVLNKYRVDQQTRACKHCKLSCVRDTPGRGRAGEWASEAASLIFDNFLGNCAHHD